MNQSESATRNYEVGENEWPELYERLHEIAANQMSQERSGHLLQTTAVVHEAYMRLSKPQQSQFKDKNTFFAAAAVVMRRVLVDFARSEKAAKRGGNKKRQMLTDSRLAFGERGYSTIDIHDALERLAEFAPVQARALELMIFAGMTGEEVAVAIEVSPSTVDRKIRSAKAWLRRELSDD